MIDLSAYRGKTLGVFGIGLSGQSTIAALRAGGAVIWAWDDNGDNIAACRDMHGDVSFAPVADWPWGELTALVLSPGVPLTHPEPHESVTLAREAGCRIIGDIELLCEATPDVRKIAITGTNGKSTTTALVGHLLQEGGVKAAVGGNIGIPALSLDIAGKDWLVLELSSYQLDLIDAARFDVAALLNVTPDHLSRHGGLEGYVEAKRRIFRGRGIHIVSLDDAPCRMVYESLRMQADAGYEPVPISVGEKLDSGVSVVDGIVFDSGRDQTLDLRDCAALKGAHNWQNAAAAVAITVRCGVAFVDIQRGLESFGGLPHRMQRVAQVGPVVFVNDSKGTNADATQHALKAYDNIYWIAGGVAKEGGIASLIEYFPKIRQAYFIGDAAEEFAEFFNAQARVSGQVAGMLERAVMAAYTDAIAAGGGAVLLSPACASFDQFKNFEARGDAFATLAKNIEKMNGEQAQHAAATA